MSDCVPKTILIVIIGAVKVHSIQVSPTKYGFQLLHGQAIRFVIKVELNPKIFTLGLFQSRYEFYSKTLAPIYSQNLLSPIFLK